MKQRTGTQIEQKAIELLSRKECIGIEIQRELSINSKMMHKILMKMEDRGILVKKDKPSMRINRLCTHYRISLSSQQSLRSEKGGE